MSTSEINEMNEISIVAETSEVAETNRVVDTNEATENSSKDIKVDEFKKQLNKTKFCRINAYKRCCMWDSFFKVIACIYSLSVISLSILLLIPNTIIYIDHTMVSAFLIIASVCTFALDLFLREVNYSSKAEQYKKAYNEIENILAAIDTANLPITLTEYKQRYETLIENSINHVDQDYYRYVYDYVDEQSAELNDNDKNFSSRMKNKYRWHEARDFLVKCGFSFTIYFFVWFFTFICSVILNRKDKKSRRKSGASN